MINIAGLNKGKVLAALYNHSKPQGLGWLQATDGYMSEDEANSILKGQSDFDYLKGRVMKIDVSGNELDPWGYDRDNGQGAVARAIDSIR